MKTTLLLLLLAAPLSAQQVTRLPAQDKLLAGKSALQFSIGAEDGEDWELLSNVRQVAFDSQENLYVLDAGNHRVLVFGPTGKYLRKIGKKGGGPGELMSPVGLAVTTDGLIAVTDLGRPAISLFKKDGTFVKNLNLGDESGFPAMSQGTYAHPKGGVVVRTMPMRMRRRPGQPQQPQTNPTSPLTWLATNDKRTSIFQIPQPDIRPKVSGSGGQVSFRVQVPAFTPPTLWGVLPDDSVAVGYDDNYRLQIANNGKVARVIERPFSPRKVTEADKHAERARRRQEMASGRSNMVMRTAERGASGATRGGTSVGGSIPAAQTEEMLRELTLAETIPALAGLYADPLGRLWVQRTGARVGADGPIDLIAIDGGYIGTLAGQSLPAAVSVSGRAAYIERDDMDVEKVVVRRLPSGWK